MRASRSCRWGKVRPTRSALEAVLERFTDDVVKRVTDPITGIQTKCKFPPSIAEVVELCESIRRQSTYASTWDKRAAEQIAEGELDVDADVDSQDEFGRLADAFGGSVSYLQEMAAVAERIADGHLNVEVNPRSERDVLGNAFSRMREKLAATIENIARNSESVGAASTEMAQSSQQAGMAVGEIEFGDVERIAEGVLGNVRVRIAVHAAARIRRDLFDLDHRATKPFQRRRLHRLVDPFVELGDQRAGERGRRPYHDRAGAAGHDRRTERWNGRAGGG